MSSLPQIEKYSMVCEKTVSKLTVEIGVFGATIFLYSRRSYFDTLGSSQRILS